MKGLVLVLLAVTVLAFSPYKALTLNQNQITLLPSLQHPLGTDTVGRDYLTLLAKATLVTLGLGLYTAFMTIILAVLVAFASTLSPLADRLLMRLAELVHALPLLPMVLAVSSILSYKILSGQRIMLALTLVGLISWPSMAIMMRNLLIKLKQEPVICMAKAVGYSPFFIAYRYSLPVFKPLLGVYMARLMARALLAESSLSFLGFGVIEPNVSLGLLLSYAKYFNTMVNFSFQWIPAGIVLTLCIIIFYSMVYQGEQVK